MAIGPSDPPPEAPFVVDELIAAYMRRERGNARRGLNTAVTHAARPGAQAAICGEVVEGRLSLPWTWVRTTRCQRCAELAVTGPVPMFPA